MLRRGAVGHNHLWFYRDAIEALLSAGDGADALEYVAALEDYTRAEPLPWSESIRYPWPSSRQRRTRQR